MRLIYWGSDHVTLIGHVRAGMGYRNEFQTENYLKASFEEPSIHPDEKQLNGP